jgi:hypothetical protein
MTTISFGPFLGINNRRPNFDLHADRKGDFLETATNVDVDNAGHLRSRPGVTLIQAMSNAHSLFLTSDTSGYLVRSGSLYAITLPTYTETLVKVLSVNTTVSYALYGGEVYCSNTTQTFRLVGSSYFPMSLPTPSAPGLAATTGGLLEGHYQVAVSYVNTTTGEEGGISSSTTITLASTGGIVVTLPASTEGATHINVYLSQANGSVTYLKTTVAVGTAAYTVTALATGREETGRFEIPLPAGTLFVHNGKLCSFSGSTVYLGLPYRPGYCLAVDGYIPFPSTVSNAISGQNGIYVVADKTYWIPDEGTIVDVLPYGGVAGTAFTIPNSSSVGWFGTKGVVIGDIQGNVKAVMSDAITLTPPSSGFSVVFEGEYRKVVSCNWCVNLDTGAATTYSAWDMTSASRNYGTKTDGLYSTNGSGDVYATVSLGDLKLGDSQIKMVPNAYLGFTSTSELRITIRPEGGTQYTYDTRSASSDLLMQRVDMGRGLRATWFEATISNPSGEAFILASVIFSVYSSKRKI